jgi:PAS domain S-box-containing protein
LDNSLKTREQLIAENEALRGELRRLTSVTDEDRLTELSRIDRLLDVHFPVCIAYTDAEQKYRFVNKTYEDWFGITIDEIRGRPVKDVIGEEAYKVVRAYMERALAGEVVSYEAHVPYLAGRARHIHGELVPDFDSEGTVLGYFLIIRDVSRRKEAEAALQALNEELEQRVAERTAALQQENDERSQVEELLRASESKHRSLFENSPVGIISVDTTGRILEVNPKLVELLGSPSPEATKTINMFEFPPLIESGFADVFKQCISTGKTLSVEGPYISKWGRNSIFRVLLTPIKEGESGVLGCQAVIEDVTERKQAEESLRRNKETLETILNNIPVMVAFLDSRSRHQYVNQSWRDTLGWTLEEAQNDDIFARWYPDPTHREFFLECAAQASGAWNDFRTVTRDGRAIDTSWAHIPLSDGSRIAIGLDITDRKRAEQALRESEERRRLALDAAGAGTWEWDLRTNENVWSEQLWRLYGLEPFSVQPSYEAWRDAIHPDDRAQVETTVQHAAENGIELNAEWRTSHPEGGERRLMYRGRPLCDANGRPLRYFGIVVDITDRKRAEELSARAERLNAVGELAGGVAHNFNNLLQIVLGGSQLALTDLELGNVAQAKDNLEQIVHSAKFGAQTVRRLQEFARTRPDAVLGPGKVFDLAETVVEAVEMSKPWWKTKPEKDGVRVSLVRSINTGLYVKGHESELFEVIVNLIKNAVEALSGPGEIRISTGSDDAGVLLTVEDTGTGIARENLGKVFEPFWTTKGYHGTGMGLAGSYGIVRRHGGEITVQSESGHGAVFTVRLPHASEPPEAKAAPVVPTTDLRLNILVADDVPAVIKQLEGGLTTLGQTVFTASSGSQALEIFSETPVDVIVCDLAMPGINGWQVGEAVVRVSAERGTPKPVFIVLTGWGGQFDEQSKMTDAGVDAILEKPVDVGRLFQIIEDLFKKRHA